MTLTKNDLIKNLYLHHDLSQTESPRIIETMIEIMKRALESGEEILISGFGKFHIKNKRARKGRNPSTGEAMMLDTRRVITFTCSKKLREGLN